MTAATSSAGFADRIHGHGNQRGPRGDRCAGWGATVEAIVRAIMPRI